MSDNIRNDNPNDNRTAAPATFSNTSPGPGRGFSTSRSEGADWYFSKTTARIELSPFDWYWHEPQRTLTVAPPLKHAGKTGTRRAARSFDGDESL